MKKQRVMKFGGFNNIGDPGASIYYRIACNCTDPQCDMHLELESEINQIYLNISKKLVASAQWGYTGEWYVSDFIRVFINKMRMICRILFFGYIEVNETLILEGSDHVDEFIAALEEGKRFLIESEKKYEGKKE
jgi:hypothetical protein